MFFSTEILNSWKKQIIAFLLYFWIPVRNVLTDTSIPPWMLNIWTLVTSLRKKSIAVIEFSGTTIPAESLQENSPKTSDNFIVSWVTSFHDNERVIHCSEVLNNSPNPLTFFSTLSQRALQDDYPIVKKIVQAVFSLEEIERISIRRLHMVVVRGKVFSWDEITLKINIAVAAVFDYKPDDITDITDCSVFETHVS